MLPFSEIKIFPGSGGRKFAERMCDYLEVEMGKSEVITFTEGNIYVKCEETVRDKDVYLIQPIGLNPNKEFTEILFWLDAFQRASVHSVTAVIPYFGYAQGDKKDEPRVSIRGRVCAESIEQAGADRVVTMDLHSAQIQGFFKKPVDHLFARPILCEYFRHTLELDNTVLVSPDAGFAKEVRQYAEYLQLPVAIGDKKRRGHKEDASLLEIIGEVEGKDVIIFDDFAISGGTLVNLAEELRKRGAEEIHAGLSHLLLSEEGVDRIENSCLNSLVGTDTVYNPAVAGSSRIKEVSVAPLFAEIISRIHRRESVTPLFEQVPEKVLNCSVKMGGIADEEL